MYEKNRIKILCCGFIPCFFIYFNNVVILGGGLVGCETALLLDDCGKVIDAVGQGYRTVRLL